jgi:hypothetical protein
MKIKFTWRQRWYHLQIKIHRFLVHHTPLPICQGFDGPCFKRGKYMRQATAYVDDKRNWVTLCPKCAQLNNEYWMERWDEYYSQCM